MNTATLEQMPLTNELNQQFVEMMSAEYATPNMDIAAYALGSFAVDNFNKSGSSFKEASTVDANINTVGASELSEVAQQNGIAIVDNFKTAADLNKFQYLTGTNEAHYHSLMNGVESVDEEDKKE